jgi:hypothetical protein
MDIMEWHDRVQEGLIYPLPFSGGWNLPLLPSLPKPVNNTTRIISFPKLRKVGAAPNPHPSGCLRLQFEILRRKWLLKQKLLPELLPPRFLICSFFVIKLTDSGVRRTSLSHREKVARWGGRGSRGKDVSPSLLRSVIDPTWGVYDWTCEEGYFYLSVYIKERPALIFFLAKKHILRELFWIR